MFTSFFTALVFAYLLQPLMRLFDGYSIPRSVISFLILISLISCLFVAGLFLLPELYRQFSLLITKVPQYKLILESIISQWSQKLNHIDSEIATRLSNFIHNSIDNIFSMFSLFINQIWEYTLATINLVLMIFLFPILLFYFLKDWKKIMDFIDLLLPPKNKERFKLFISEIDNLLSAYIRGQLNICFISSIYYIFFLSLIGIDLAIFIGLASGLLIIIPFLGFIISISIACISCYSTFGYGVELLYVTFILCFGHMIEAYIVAPKIIGSKIGLHPVWIIFSILVLASIFGFWGILFAIPIAGIVKIIFGYVIKYYHNSNLYR